MRIFSTYFHGILDYAMGLFLIISPWILGFSHVPQATMVMVIFGAVTIAYSLLTRYELGTYRLIPMTGHLVLDLMAGALLLISPWLFSFASQVYLPHLILGSLEIGVALMTDTSFGHHRVRTLEREIFGGTVFE